MFLLKDRLKAFNDWKGIQYNIYWDKKKKIYFGQNKSYKKCTLFMRELQLIRFTINLRYLYDVKQMVHLSKSCVGFSIFDSVSFLSNFIFLFNKSMALWL